jgi:TolB protein
MSADGSGVTRLADGGYPAWSPDGTQIVFMHADWIFVMNTDGSGAHALAPAGSNAQRSAWSPDGSRIAYSCSAGGSSVLCVMNADGSGASVLVDRTSLNVFGYDCASNPTWSPDGDRIAFAAPCGGSGANGEENRLLVLDLQTGVVAAPWPAPMGSDGSALADSPAWRPRPH